MTEKKKAYTSPVIESQSIALPTAWPCSVSWSNNPHGGTSGCYQHFSLPLFYLSWFPEISCSITMSSRTAWS